MPIPYQIMPLANIEIKRRSTVAMNNSHGKAFEDRLRKTARMLGWYVLRLPTPVSYYTLRMPGDFILFTPNTTLLIECKATKHDKYKPASMRQYDKFKEFNIYKTQGNAAVIVDFIDSFGEHTYSHCLAADVDTKVLTAEESCNSLRDVLLSIEVVTVCK